MQAAIQDNASIIGNYWSLFRYVLDQVDTIFPETGSGLAREDESSPADQIADAVGHIVKGRAVAGLEDPLKLLYGCMGGFEKGQLLSDWGEIRSNSALILTLWDMGARVLDGYDTSTSQ